MKKIQKIQGVITMGERIIAILLLVFVVYICIWAYIPKNKVPKYNGEKIKCPRCGGIHYHAYVENQVIVPEKVKGKTTLNINPLKPFTVFNHEEQVVRGAVTRKVSRFVCDDCGNIFG